MNVLRASIIQKFILVKLLLLLLCNAGRARIYTKQPNPLSETDK